LLQGGPPDSRCNGAEVARETRNLEGTVDFSATYILIHQALNVLLLNLLLMSTYELLSLNLL
jgi:hypothetical protein